MHYSIMGKIRRSIINVVICYMEVPYKAGLTVSHKKQSVTFLLKVVPGSFYLKFWLET
jgi:hypothetical protein